MGSHTSTASSDQSTALWAVPVSNLAGVARHVLDVAEVGLPGWRLVVAAPPGPLIERLRALGVTVHEADIAPDVRFDRAVLALRRIIQRVKPQVVHSHLARADLLAAMATVGLPPKLVTTEHHIPEDRLMFHRSLAQARVMETIHHLRLRRFDAAMAVSASTKRDMLTYWRPTLDVSVVLNGVDRRPITRRGPGHRYLSLTRLSSEKNVEMTLEVFAEIVRHEPHARLTVGGTGDSEEQLRSLARSVGIADQVRFAGFIDADEAMANHDVVLQPSKSDNFSYTLLDAIAAGMGVVASPVGGNPEMLPEQCIASLDNVPAFAAKALEQGRQPELRPALPDSVPTRAEMAGLIVAEYDRARGQR